MDYSGFNTKGIKLLGHALKPVFHLYLYLMLNDVCVYKMGIAFLRKTQSSFTVSQTNVLNLHCYNDNDKDMVAVRPRHHYLNLCMRQRKHYSNLCMRILQDASCNWYICVNIYTWKIKKGAKVYVMLSHHIPSSIEFVFLIKACPYWKMNEVNSLCPTDAIWRHRSGSTLVNQAITRRDVDLSSTVPFGI